MRLSSLVEAHVRAILISKKVTREGEVIPYAQTELTVGTDSEGEEDELFFIWPTTIIHKINQDSPFYEMSAKDFLKKRYEIVVILEGVVEQTGNSIQVHHSGVRLSNKNVIINPPPPIRPDLPTSPTRCCGATDLPTCSPSNIPLPSTKLIILPSTPSIK